MWVVYELVDARDMSPFYVGITDNVYARFLQHINCEGCNFAKNARVTELRSLNIMVIMRTLEEVETKELAVKKEHYWIAYYIALGVMLLNIQHNGKVIRPESMRPPKDISRLVEAVIKPVKHDGPPKATHTDAIAVWNDSGGNIGREIMRRELIARGFDCGPNKARTFMRDIKKSFEKGGAKHGTR